METEFLYFGSDYIVVALGQHHAYVDGVSTKLVPAFDSIEAEAERYAEEEYQRFSQMPSWDGGPDLEDFAEQAFDSSVERYSSLMFVKGELIGFATGGLYHLWEKTLKSFLFLEFSKINLDGFVRKRIERSDFNALVQWLREWGFQEGEHSTIDLLDTCRLVANTVKHGEGVSCRELAKKAPELFRGSWDLELPFGEPNYEDLWIDPTKFDEFAKAIESFWREFPECFRVPPSFFEHKLR